MGTVPSMPTFSPTTGASSSQLTELAAAVSFSLNPPRALIYKSTSTSRTSAGSNVLVNFTWDTAINNTDGIWSSGSNPSRLTCNTPGLYEIEGACQWSLLSSGTGSCGLGVALNSNAVWSGAVALIEDCRPLLVTGTSFLGTGQIVKFEYFLNAGDYVELFTGQWNSAGAAVTVNGAASFYGAHFGMRWVAQS